MDYDPQDFIEPVPWNGRPGWQCLMCPHHTTTSEAAMVAHVRKHFEKRVTRRKPTIQAYKTSGQPLDLEIVEVIVEDESNQED